MKIERRWVLIAAIAVSIMTIVFVVTLFALRTVDDATASHTASTTPTLTIKATERALVLDDEGHLIDVLEPGVHHPDASQRIEIYNQTDRGAAYMTIVGRLILDNQEVEQETQVEVSIGLDDTILYMQAHPELKRVEVSAQNDVAKAIGAQFVAEYDQSDGSLIKYQTQTSEVRTDPAASSSFLTEKATVEASQSGDLSYRDKYDFRCRTVTGRLGDITALENFIKQTEVATYASLGVSLIGEVKAVHDTELPCGLKDGVAG